MIKKLLFLSLISKAHTMHSYIIQPFIPAYTQQVIDLILSIQQDEFQIPITAEQQPDLLNIQGFYQKSDGNFWIAVDDNTVIGTIALLDIGNQHAALRKMFVHQSYRGKEMGVAKRLLNTLLDHAREQKLTAIYLGTTAAFHAAHRFYEKNGFVEIAKAALPSSFPVMAVDTKFYRYTIS